MTVDMQLSQQQQQIVDAPPGPIYVKASAGSGKTRVLIARIRQALKASKKRILALTFTNKAGQEIKDRLTDIADMDNRVFAGTFHSFCQSILQNRYNLLGYLAMPHIFEQESDRLELIATAINQVPAFASQLKQKNQKEQQAYCYRGLNFISRAKRLLIECSAKDHNKNDDKELLYRSYQAILRGQNAIDFDDLLLESYRLFNNYPKVAALYRRSFYAICVDEAQDLNHAQYQFLKLLVGSDFNNILLVGDPHQAIFHFNGASAKYMNNFVADFKAETFALTENFRSSIAVLKAAKKIIPEAKYIEGTVKEGKCKIYKATDESCEARWIAEKIQAIIKMKHHDDIEGEISLENIAVLARNRYLFRPLAQAFKQLKIAYHYKMTPGSLKFESDLMQIFDLALRIELNPQDSLHLHQLRKRLKLNENEYRQLDDINKAKSLNENTRNIISVVRSLDENGKNFQKKLEQYKDKVLIDNDEEKSMLYHEIDELLIHWHNYKKRVDNTSLNQFKHKIALGQTQPLTQMSGVTLSTVHTMKGQEFDIVFIMGLDNGTFPDYRAISHQGIEMEEEKNNLYVACTRSKRWLYLSWPEYRTMPWGDKKLRKISRFLRDD